MIELPYLKVTFDTEISSQEIEAFRGAVIAKAGREHGLLHNHLSDSRRYRLGYPLVQYKRLGKRPALICLGEGIEQARHFFAQPNWDVALHGRPVSLRIDRIELQQYPIRLRSWPAKYFIRDWAGLNSEAYREYEGISGLARRIAFLEEQLRKCLHFFAVNVGLEIEIEDLYCEIEEITHRRVATVHDTKHTLFDLDFRTNLFLPNYIGLGKGTSKGFGVVSAPYRERPNNGPRQAQRQRQE